MTEREWWNKYVRKALNNKAKKWRAEKVQDAFKLGMPDLNLISCGVVAKCEMKFAKSFPKRESSRFPAECSAEQARWLDEWHECDGFSLVLIGIEDSRMFYLFDWPTFKTVTTVDSSLGKALLVDTWDILPFVMSYLSSDRMQAYPR